MTQPAEASQPPTGVGGATAARADAGPSPTLGVVIAPPGMMVAPGLTVIPGVAGAPPVISIGGTTAPPNMQNPGGVGAPSLAPDSGAAAPPLTPIPGGGSAAPPIRPARDAGTDGMDGVSMAELLYEPTPEQAHELGSLEPARHAPMAMAVIQQEILPSLPQLGLG